VKKIIKSLGYLELALIQCIFWIAVWLYDDYMGSLLTSIMVPILLGVLIVSLIAELIEKSKVPRKYFYILALSVVIPLVIALVVYFAYDGVYDWLLD